jgi:hypothetical protein
MFVTLLLLAVAMGPVGPPSQGPGGWHGSDTVPVTGTTLTVTDRYVVSGHETWDNIEVENTGQLVIPIGALLVASYIEMTGAAGFDLEGGELRLIGQAEGRPASLVGQCRHFRMTNGSALRIWGHNGTSWVDGSSGGAAILDILSMKEILISRSTLEVIGGTGFSPDSPYSETGMIGDFYSGGDAVLSLHGGGFQSHIKVTRSTVTVQAGHGGDAPDGVSPTRSRDGTAGGFSAGGRVGDRVGAGGHAWMNMTADSVTMVWSTMTCEAGEGGDAGDGGEVEGDPRKGAGGGGYSGGTGSSGSMTAASAGGRVADEVGSGGDAGMNVQTLLYSQEDTNILVRAGDGGDAGHGGACTGNGGGGGGGYSGGGGGGMSNPSGADGGAVEGEVASGGDATAIVLSDNTLDMLRSSLDVLAGSGGRAGDGGLSTGAGGGGGGGYSGGGGGSPVFDGLPGPTLPMNGGNGSSVDDYVAIGGDATLRFNSSTGYLEGNDVRVSAGDGGRGGKAGRTWQDPDTDSWMGGGGGGSYSSGGGGGYKASPNPREGGDAQGAAGSVGDGGDSSLRIEIVVPTIHLQNNFFSRRGEGGLCWRSAAAGVTGGEGAGRFTRDGRAHTLVPRSRTVLISPPNLYSSNDLPNFTWLPVHPSTTHGAVMDYTFEVAFEANFEIPLYQTTTEATNLTLWSLKKGKLYWRVTPMYSRPEHKIGIPTTPFIYTHLNSPPQVDQIPQVNITVRVPKTVDLYGYIRDIDDELDQLGITYDTNKVSWKTGLIVTLLYDKYQKPHNLYFNVSDGMATVQGHIPILIIDDNHDPVILGVGKYNPPVVISLAEGDTETLQVRWYDRDGDPVEVHVVTSWPGIKMLENYTVEISAAMGDVGTFDPLLVARDDRGGQASLTMTIRVGNVGEPPDRPVFKAPRNGTRYNEGDNVMFIVGITDPDLIFGDTVELTVISNVSGVLMVTEAGGDVTFSTDALGPGHHSITAIVKDGDFTKRSEMNLVIVGDPDPTNVWDPPEELKFVLIFVVMAIAMLGISYYAGYRKRRRRHRS